MDNHVLKPNNNQNKTYEEDVINGRIDHLLEHRLPWLIIGLLGGILVTLVVSGYEEILTADVRLAFFIPFIVYLSDAAGAQTRTVYIRALGKKTNINLRLYLIKEIAVGFGVGAIIGLILSVFAFYWLGSLSIALTIGLAMLINLTIAPILAVIIPEILCRFHSDPALSSGPIATVSQDLISLIIYFIIAGLLIL